MEFFPCYGDVEKLQLTGEYDIVPVSCELLADFITPIEALRILKNTSEHCYLLESAQASEKWGRYTFLGFEPRLEITCSMPAAELVCTPYFGVSSSAEPKNFTNFPDRSMPGAL